MGGGTSKQLPGGANDGGSAFNDIGGKSVDAGDSDNNLVPVVFRDRALGLELAPRKKGGVVVKGVVPGFPAAELGHVRRGMRMMTVDGENVSTMPLQECLAILHRAPRPVTVVFKDGIFYRRKKQSDDGAGEAKPSVADTGNGANDEVAVYASNETFADEYDGPVCFFCQAPATSRIQVGGEYQCVCDECGEWRKTAKARANDGMSSSIRKRRSDYVRPDVRKQGAVDFFVSGGRAPIVEALPSPHANVREQRSGHDSVVAKGAVPPKGGQPHKSRSIDSFLEGLPEAGDGGSGSGGEAHFFNDLPRARENTEEWQAAPFGGGGGAEMDEATAALLKQIQEEDAREAAEHQRRQQVTDRASADAIAKMQEQDRAEDADRRRRQEMQREASRAEANQLMMLQRQQEQEARAREEALLRQHYEAQQKQLENREEQMVLAAIQMSQLQNQMSEQQSAEVPEPFSWKVPKGVGYTLADLEREGGGGGGGDSAAAPRLGERHCRQRGCGCMQFREDPTRPTICSCRHGEMYHRLDEEAPLARTKVPGVYKCEYCHVDIVKENGFSGWYNEVRGSDGKSVHVECWEKYKDIIAGLCFHCQQPLRKKEGVFSGRYCKVEGRGKCHKECLEQHKVSVGEVCDLCEGALLRPYVILRDGSGGLHVRPGQENLTIHKDCWHAFLRGGGDEKKLPNWNKRIRDMMG
jgi:hypothetical protein